MHSHSGPPILTDERGLANLARHEWFEAGSVRYDAGGKLFALGLSWRRRGPYDRKVLTVWGVTKVETLGANERRPRKVADIRATPGSLEIISKSGPTIILSTEGDCEVSILSTRPLSGAEPIALSLSGCLLGLLKGLAGRKLK